MCGVERQLPLSLHGKYTFISISKVHDDLSTKQNDVTSRREHLCTSPLQLGVSSISRHGQKLATYRYAYIPHYHQNVCTEIIVELRHKTMRNFIVMANHLTL